MWDSVIVVVMGLKHNHDAAAADDDDAMPVLLIKSIQVPSEYLHGEVSEAQRWFWVWIRHQHTPKTDPKWTHNSSRTVPRLLLIA